jgi:predicted ATPase/class 3 adenylate cyclase
MADIPTGTVTFLFTDIEGRTKLAQLHPNSWEAARQRHDAVLREAFEAHQGYVFQISGDAFCVAYATAPDALAASVAAQHALHKGLDAEAGLALAQHGRAHYDESTEAGDPPLQIRVRMGLHAGSAEARDGGYQGYLTLAHVQRVMSVAYGGQTLVSDATAALLHGQLPEGITLRDIGEHRLKGLLNPEHLWQVIAPDLVQDFPPLQSLNAMPNNLPIQVTSFIGRERELSELQRLLPTTRLLTLTGSGGTGKTRLSLQAGAEFCRDVAVLHLPSVNPNTDVAVHSGKAPERGRLYPDGVWFVELAPLSDPALVPATIASVLGVREEQGRPHLVTLLEWLRPKELLLILDNCEHLIDACARFADAVLHTSRGTRILASSREALGVAGEQTFPVPSLQVPSPQTQMSVAQLTEYESIRLFVERAKLVKVDFELTSANAAAVMQVCARLDGIPLALELAAARVKVMRVEQIAERLDDRFRLLTGGSRTALPRQQTLRGAIDWSHSLLPEAERSLLRRLSVFAGGWTLEAAEEVCADDSRADGRPLALRERRPSATPKDFPPLPAVEVLDLLDRLIDKSLVVADGVGEGETTRYHLLETMRQYAREKLLDAGESERLRDRHLAFFLKLAEEAEPHLTGPAQATWFARLERDYANLRAADEWSLQEADASHGMRLASALATLQIVRGPLTEGLDWLVRAVSRPEATAPAIVRARALLATARVLGLMGEPVRSNTYVEESLTISRALAYRAGVARALFQLGVNARWQGDLKTARPLLEQSLAIREGLDIDAIVFTYVNLGLIAEVEGDYDAARKYFEQAMTVAQAAESSHSVAIAFAYLGILAFGQRDYDGAEAAFEQGLNAGRAIGHQVGVSLSSRGLAYVALQRGLVERAAALCRESLLINRERSAAYGTAASLATYAALAVARGQPERSARLYGSAAARLVGNVDGRHRLPHDQAEQERHIDELRSRLDDVQQRVGSEEKADNGAGD